MVTRIDFAQVLNKALSDDKAIYIITGTGRRRHVRPPLTISDLGIEFAENRRDRLCLRWDEIAAIDIT